MGIGIKFYLDKVGNKLILNADQLTNIQSFKKEKWIGKIAEWRSRPNRSECADGISNGIPSLRQEMGISKETSKTRFAALPLFSLTLIEIRKWQKL